MVKHNLQISCIFIGCVLCGGHYDMIRSEGYKTKNRQQILDILKNRKDQSVSVSEIKESMEQMGCNVNLSTIYRYMDKLVEEGIVMEYLTKKGEKAGFQYLEPEQDCHQHLHLQCIRCGRIIHLNCSFMKDIQMHIGEYHGFTIQCDHSILYGICQTCQKK